MWNFLWVILPMESPRDSKRQLRTVTWPIHSSYCRQTHQGIQTGISVQWRDLFTIRMADGIHPSVSPSAKVNIWPPCRPSPPLFLLLLPHPTLPYCKQPAPPKKISLFSAQQVIFLEVLWSQHPCSDLPMDFISFCK